VPCYLLYAVSSCILTFYFVLYFLSFRNRIICSWPFTFVLLLICIWGDELMFWHIFPPLWINLTEVEALLDFRNNLYGLQGGIFLFMFCILFMDKCFKLLTWWEIATWPYLSLLNYADFTVCMSRIWRTQMHCAHPVYWCIAQVVQLLKSSLWHLESKE